MEWKANSERGDMEDRQTERWGGGGGGGGEEEHKCHYPSLS